MAGTISRLILGSCIGSLIPNTNFRSLHTAGAVYAARKGTREKARAKKVKVEITKAGFIPHNQRGTGISKKTNVNKHLDDGYKQISTDDVYPMRYYQRHVRTLAEAVEAHRETHHPTMYNNVDAFIIARIEFNMEAAKKNKYVENFSRISLLPHTFPRDEQRTILVFAKGQDILKASEDAGATTVGGVEIVKKIQDGELKLFEYDYIIAHPNILTDLVPIRGLMKKRFPSLKAGTLDLDVPGLVKKLNGGVQFRVAKDEHQSNFASVDIAFGRLNMDIKLLEENLAALFKDINGIRPKRPGLFITRCFVRSPPGTELFKIDPFVYIDRTLSSQSQDDSDDEDDVQSARA